MGYTHYWRQSRTFTDDEWTKLAAFAQRLVQGAKRHGIVLAGWDGTGEPDIDEDSIGFNGVPDHETFRLERVPTVQAWQDEHFSFCKTNRKPYDVAVVTMLATAKAIAPDAIHISSDDGPEVFSPSNWLPVDRA